MTSDHINKAIVLYLHVHQPHRLRHYTIFDVGYQHNYFDSPPSNQANNEEIIHKIAHKSYLPTNELLLRLIEQHPEFKINLSLTGTVIEQLEKWSPQTLDSFKKLVATGRVEILAETYHHSLAYFYSKSEFEAQVKMHEAKIQEVFGQKPAVFRNTELAYNNQLATWAEAAGYKGILAEGWDPILGWHSPNFVYKAFGTKNLALLLKNYKLSDDVAFRFGNRDWNEWPLTADKYVRWLNEIKDATNFNIFMDYETIGEHQWDHTGIFDFFENLPKQWLKEPGKSFMTVSEVIEANQPRDEIDFPYTVTWADTERDLSAWLGNPMQHQAVQAVYGLADKILDTNDVGLIEDWRKLQTSDHFYYMCTKWFNDGDIHAYFSPYESPYVAYMNFMNTFHDIEYRLAEKGTPLV